MVFFRIKKPCVPTEMVHALLEGKVQSKWIHRLTPVTRTGKATVEGIEEVAKAVLGPHFHGGQDGVKVRPPRAGIYPICSLTETHTHGISLLFDLQHASTMC